MWPRWLRLAVLALLAVLWVPAPAAWAAPEHDAAQAFVLRHDLGKNLMGIAWVVIIDTKAYKDIKKKLGNTEAQELVTRELEALRGHHQDQWNRNLVNAYARHLSTAELRSLAADGKASPYVGRLREKQAQIGEDLSASSKTMVGIFVSEALANASARAAVPR